MAEKELINRVTKESSILSEKLENTLTDLLKLMDQLKELERAGELTIPYLKGTIKKSLSIIEACNREIRQKNNMYSVCEKEMQRENPVIWDEYFRVQKTFNNVVADFISFTEQYKYFVPNNSKELENQVQKILDKKGYIVDSYFEGDYDTWIGVYARPKDKPTYLDPANAEEATLQEKYSLNGFKQDFSEWFEWEIKNNEVVSTN
ncbi:Phi-29-like late activator [Enterococcus mundtii]|uniref:Phi-29-like late activator n=1 Tax=Enterococcus mundtii TaxID=53346 RepID=A0ABQ0VG44_ENTMU|nr:Phi-29-like late activator [Enterococcus mundtii]AUB53360.1 Phi-29-like late activator [Enterococcus mundtii]OJG57370.1 hypothetical protein RV08_GL002132 [Enterococcus mundtii]GEL81634.1 hypothetical protein EMU01_27780 [Enterococcus mundtii]GEN20065.1 hypothetical protein LAC02_33460 [Ligilactobacillus acidipiscis]